VKQCAEPRRRRRLPTAIPNWPHEHWMLNSLSHCEAEQCGTQLPAVVARAALLLADLAELLSVGMIIWADRLCIKTYLIPIFILQDHLVFFFLVLIHDLLNTRNSLKRENLVTPCYNCTLHSCMLRNPSSIFSTPVLFSQTCWDYTSPTRSYKSMGLWSF
jgi:hypothetical protein